MIDISNDSWSPPPWNHGLSLWQHVQIQNSKVLHTFPTGSAPYSTNKQKHSKQWSGKTLERMETCLTWTQLVFHHVTDPFPVKTDTTLSQWVNVTDVRICSSPDHNLCQSHPRHRPGIRLPSETRQKMSLLSHPTAWPSHARSLFHKYTLCVDITPDIEHHKHINHYKKVS